jgi:site-specific DNA recombinase
MRHSIARRVLGYARVSSIEQALGTSLQDQQDAMAAYARSLGLTITKFFVETESGVGAKTEQRVKMASLLGEVREGDLVICTKLDRWSRDTKQTLISVDEILKRKASFYAIDDACDPSTPNGYMMMTVRAALATSEHARIKDRTVGTRLIHRNSGLWSEGKVPIGYRRTLPKGSQGPNKNVLLIVADMATVVRRVFALCIAGRSIKQISIATALSMTQVVGVLRQRAYAGQIQNTSGEWIKARHEAIVDLDTFMRARDARSERRKGSAKPRSEGTETSSWILRDVARCNTCGARMTSSFSGARGTANRRHYYSCSKKCVTSTDRGHTSWNGAYVPVREIEEAALPVIAGRLVQLRAELARPHISKAAPRALDTTAKRAKLAARRDRLVVMCEHSVITLAEFKSKVAAVDDALTHLDVEEMASKRPARAADPKVRREMLATVERLLRAWELAKPSTRRAIVNALVLEARLVKGETPTLVWRDHDSLAGEIG